MQELLLELFSEEIPARMQVQAAADLGRLLTQKLADLGLQYGEVKTYSTPRRLTALIKDLVSEEPQRVLERRGPRVDAPEGAIQGFLKSTGFESLDQCEQMETPKGTFWIAKVTSGGGKTIELLPAIIKDILHTFPWPKSMHWRHSTISWVRPLQSILCVYGGQAVEFDVDLSPELSTEDPKKVIVKSSNQTQGHRFLNPASFVVKDFYDYKAKLQASYVILDSEDRKHEILRQISTITSAKGLILKSDEGLLNEVAGLVEWPHGLLGTIDQEFMNLPPELLSTTMRVHQRYFTILDAQGKMAPFFLTIANTIPQDEGRTAIAGNERVLRARLADAAFFYDQDKKISLEDHGKKLHNIVFHAALGTIGQKAERMEKLAEFLSHQIKSSPTLSARAAVLAKADLASQMVGEFPELQGIIGSYYAKDDPAEIRQAIAEHYSPKGPNDQVPNSPISVTVALSDKIDSMVGFFTQGIVPTGSKDPYALRRMALGVIRLLLENNLEGLNLPDVFAKAHKLYSDQQLVKAPLPDSLWAFLMDRFKVYLREQGSRHDVVAAILQAENSQDLVEVAKRIKLLDQLLQTETGEQVAANYKRAINIVRIEEKKDKTVFQGIPQIELFETEQEKFLHSALVKLQIQSQFENQIQEVAHIRPALDDFFDQVTVNCETPEIRLNRLQLLAMMRDILSKTADLEQIQGS